MGFKWSKVRMQKKEQLKSRYLIDVIKKMITMNSIHVYDQHQIDFIVLGEKKTAYKIYVFANDLEWWIFFFWVKPSICLRHHITITDKTHAIVISWNTILPTYFFFLLVAKFLMENRIFSGHLRGSTVLGRLPPHRLVL